ncbi:MAG: trypsin-like peptidase domain-containing protein [Saprospiraceae bacterium]|nr:trypsin-like peptidase domain-containing protein [Saprospiraceae bacterium]
MVPEWVKDLNKIVVQIATPYATGTGFIFPAHDVIVTNEHVVRDNRNAVVEGAVMKRQLADILYIDEKYDIALLQLPKLKEVGPQLNWCSIPPTKGSQVFACGHPFGYKFSVTQGIISTVEYELGNLYYIQHDAALNPGNSGGPLLNDRGELLGVNTFMVEEGQNIGIALPFGKLRQILTDYDQIKPERASRCPSCEFLLFEERAQNDYCPNCGAVVKYISDVQEYEPVGIGKKIEDVLSQLGYDVAICRRGMSNWEITHGSAKVNVAYHEQSGFLIADATLCYLPKTSMEDIYTYLMKQNYHNKGMTFSLKDNNIVISSLIYDQHMHFESCKKIIDRLIKSADKYDNILIQNFGAEALLQ